MPRPLDTLSSFARGASEDGLGRLAVQRGLITRADLAAALRRQEAESPRPPLGVVLVATGLLSHEGVADLLALQAAGPDDDASPTPGAPAAAAVSRRPPCPARRRGRPSHRRSGRRNGMVQCPQPTAFGRG